MRVLMKLIRNLNNKAKKKNQLKQFHSNLNLQNSNVAVTTSPPVPQASVSHNCDYRELLTNLHDRISLLVTVDEDLRQRLDSIDKK